MATQEAVMTTQDIANRLHELFKENKWQEVQDELFSDNAGEVSACLLSPDAGCCDTAVTCIPQELFQFNDSLGLGARGVDILGGQVSVNFPQHFGA